MQGWERLTEEQRSLMVQLENDKTHGAGIFIDGREAPENEWDKIFMLKDHADDGSSQFYVLDYIFDEAGNLTEVRIDRIKIRDL